MDRRLPRLGAAAILLGEAKRLIFESSEKGEALHDTLADLANEADRVLVDLRIEIGVLQEQDCLEGL